MQRIIHTFNLFDSKNMTLEFNLFEPRGLLNQRHKSRVDAWLGAVVFNMLSYNRLDRPLLALIDEHKHGMFPLKNKMILLHSFFHAKRPRFG